jgi:hypothetical protein
MQARGESTEVFPWCAFRSRDVAETSNAIPEHHELISQIDGSVSPVLAKAGK